MGTLFIVLLMVGIRCIWGIFDSICDKTNKDTAGILFILFLIIIGGIISGSYSY